MKIIYSPFVNKTNKYVDIIKRVLQANDIEVVNLKENICPSKLKDISFADFNWLEAKVNQRSWVSCLISYIKSILLLYWLKVNNVKIIYTVHNKISHDCIHKKINEQFIATVLRMSDRIVVLCEESKKMLREMGDNKNIVDKIMLIQLPNYIGECFDYYESLNNNYGTFSVSFIGAVKHYKNIELLIEVANKCKELDMEFNIYGKPESESYADELRKKVSNSKIRFSFSFLEDKELYRVIKESDLLVFPYDKVSSLNSASIMLSFSLGRNAVCPCIGTIKEFPNDIIYSYDYNNELEHKYALYKLILKAYDEYKNDFNFFKEKSESLYKFVKENNSEEVIGQKYKELFSSSQLTKRGF
ncbi:glycosyltransferase [Sporolactobacillus sp. STCC-11]|uniref:glycosyltransferase n=1 Tax=Sporolactobacillus caesalpiniae TaxID=3230362 RepID=UPI00339791A5